MHYTHYGIGHPTTLREIARDCAGLDLVSDNDMDFESDIQPCEGDGETQGCDDSDDDGGSEDEEEEEEECEDGERIDDPDEAEMRDGEDQYQEEDEEDDYHVSF